MHPTIGWIAKAPAIIKKAKKPKSPCIIGYPILSFVLRQRLE